MDKITVSEEGNEKVEQIIKNNLDEIKGDVLATDIVFGKADGFTKEWNLNGQTVTLGVTKN